MLNKWLCTASALIMHTMIHVLNFHISHALHAVQKLTNLLQFIQFMNTLHWKPAIILLGYYFLCNHVLHLGFNRWDYFPEQFSDPVYLEAGKYYYFQVVANQYTGPWNVGLAAKVHSLNHTSYPYQGDKEKQRINITSTTVREKIVSEFTTKMVASLLRWFHYLP